MAESIIGNKDTLIQKAALLRITTKTLANTLQNGSFKSLYHGQGIEFSGVREYLRGDDVRTIDWNVTARSAKPYVKIFEEERELQIFLVIDRSLSMQTGSKGKARLNTAMETAALLTLAAENNANPVGAVLFGGEIEFVCSPKSGATQTMILLSQFDKKPEHTKCGSVLANALTGAGKILKKRSLVFVISDFRMRGWENGLTHLAQRHDVVCVKIGDPSDYNLPEMGAIPFVDPENGIRKVMPTNSRMFRAAWREDGRMRTQRFSDTCLRHGAYPLKISTTEDCLTSLSNFFMSRDLQ
ncbi:MAG: DUF58 domain-containing protein [Treponema sp.]|nr:DUF58 domain-containing protein [Candidatus Treponema merdequi]